MGRETEQIAFQASTGALREGVVSIASILNRHGSGDLYFGVANSGDVVGLDISGNTMREISQAIRSDITPPIYPVIEERQYGGRNVVHVQFAGRRRPYLAYGLPRIRVGDEDVQMNQDLYREMLNERENRGNRTDSWEARMSQYKIEDLDTNVFDRYLRQAKSAGRIPLETDSPREVMAQLGLAVGDVLTNAGAALFVHSGINELQYARFATDERLTILDTKRDTGPILTLVHNTVEYVANAMEWRVETDETAERRERPEIPVAAIREAVLNAFAHRVIESMQAVDVGVYKRYIDITSPGKFPDSVTPEQFLTEPLTPIRRNPLITRTLYYSDGKERFATGLRRIQKVCADAGVKVEFLKREYAFTVRFHRHCGEGWDKVQRDTGSMAYKRAKVKNLIRQNPKITREQMAAAMGMRLRSVQCLLKEMDDVHFTGGGRQGHWEIT